MMLPNVECSDQADPPFSFLLFLSLYFYESVDVKESFKLMKTNLQL